MLAQPIVLTFYEPDTQEVKKTYTQNVISFEMLMEAAKLSELMDPVKMAATKRRWPWEKELTTQEQQIQAVMALVVRFFNGQFSVDDLKKYADVSEVMSVLRAITARASGLMTANPTVPLPAQPIRKRH